MEGVSIKFREEGCGRVPGDPRHRQPGGYPDEFDPPLFVPDRVIEV